MSQSADADNASPGWGWLYRVGGAAAIVMAVFIPIQIIVLVVWPLPGTVQGWFALFQNNHLVGLLDMDLLLIIDQILMVLVLLALYVALKRTNPSFTTIALTLGLLGIAAYFASTSAFEMLSLSDQYAAATTETQRSIIQAAGQVALANWQGTAFDVGYVLEGIGLLIMALVTLRSTIFSKMTAWAGILLGVMSLIPPTAGTVGLFFSLGSLLPLEVWDILIGQRLIRLGQDDAR